MNSERILVVEDILIEAKILAVADAIEDVTVHRSYINAPRMDEALATISSRSGTVYDPEVVISCLRLFRERGYKMED